MAYRYRQEAATKIAAIIQNAPEDATVHDLRHQLREQGPQAIDSPRFRIYHQEARRQLLDWVKARTKYNQSSNLFNSK